MNKDNLNKNDFNVPENYFDSLKENILLNSLKKENKFDVPKDYFQELEKNILEKSHQKESKNKQKKIFKLNYWLAAASVLIFVLLSIKFIPINSEKPIQQIVNVEVEEEVYEKIYNSFIIDDDEEINSSNITLDESDYVLYNNYY